MADISVATDEEWMMMSGVDAAGELLNVCVNLEDGPACMGRPPGPRQPKFFEYGEPYWVPHPRCVIRPPTFV